VYEYGDKLGDAHEFADLIQSIFPPKTKARPAKASSVTASDDHAHRTQCKGCGNVTNCRCPSWVKRDTTIVESCPNCKLATAKPKCPHCGSSDYGLMPTDFETAKCNQCGKNWHHGIVPGINDPFEKKASDDDEYWLDLVAEREATAKKRFLESPDYQQIAQDNGWTPEQAWEEL